MLELIWYIVNFLCAVFTIGALLIVSIMFGIALILLLGEGVVLTYRRLFR